jgi:hypothetical protein
MDRCSNQPDTGFGRIYVNFHSKLLQKCWFLIDLKKQAPVKSKRTLSLSFKYAVCNAAYLKNGAKVSLRSIARQ